jgi:hypothetical protein
VRRDRRQIDVHRLDVEGHLADALHGVGVKQHAALAAELADLAMGCTVPTSLLASITRHEDRLVGDAALLASWVDHAALCRRAGR